MCSGTDSNRWAPRLVIILQLATWSIVGIVLLQRGATSLRSIPPEEEKSAAQIQVGAVSDPKHEEIQDTLDCQEREAKWAELNGKEDLDTRRRDDRESGLPEAPKQYQGDLTPNSDNSRGTKNDESSPDSTTTEPCDRLQTLEGDDNNEISNRNFRKRMRPARARERIAQGQLLDNNEKKKKKALEDESIKDYFLSVTSAELDSSEESSRQQRNGTNLPDETTSKDISGGIASSSRGEAPRLKPVDRAGAAAAVAMLAIGVVMLLLAPAIVILRAIESRRRERRLPKLRARKDLPPTYEEATFMDEAPRYSSLHLNAINEPSPETSLTITSRGS